MEKANGERKGVEMRERANKREWNRKDGWMEIARIDEASGW